MISISSKQQGFTLVELLIVVIILALLSAIVVPQFASSTDDARSSAADTSLANLRAVIDLYYQQHGEYPGANTAVSGACGGTAGTGDPAGGSADTAFLEQLSLYTDADGKACSIADATHEFGPYMKKPQLEPEPFGNSNALKVVTVGDLNMTAEAGDPGGYLFDSKTGKIIINIAAEQDR